jgi:hypothetical protein
MLYFTHRFSKGMALKGVYNGRFSFIAGVMKEELEAIFERVVRGGDINRNDKDVAVAAVREEFEHKKLYYYCLTGLILNGFRLVARLCWAKFRRRGMAEYYYEMRTLFFGVMYPLHESMVGSADKTDLKVKKKKIRRADVEVLRLWLKRPLTWTFIPVAWLFWLMGRFFSGSFAIIHVHYVDGRMVERNYAEKGIVNQVGNVGAVRHRWMARVMEMFRIERLFRVKNQRDWEWMLMKFMVEHRNWQRTLSAQEEAIDKLHLSKTKHRTHENFNEYLREILGFVAEWIGIDSAFPITIIIKAFKRTLAGETVPRPRGGKWDTMEYRKLLNFFYLHGN